MHREIIDLRSNGEWGNGQGAALGWARLDQKSFVKKREWRGRRVITGYVRVPVCCKMNSKRCSATHGRTEAYLHSLRRPWFKAMVLLGS